MHQLQEVCDLKEDNMESEQYLTGNMDRGTIMALLRKEGFRITRQRKILIDIILNEECTCCKEMYYLASRQERGIGIATIYRTISSLEKIGALERKNPYQLCCHEQTMDGKFLVELEDDSVVELDLSALYSVIETGLRQCGYSRGKCVKEIRHVK